MPTTKSRAAATARDSAPPTREGRLRASGACSGPDARLADATGDNNAVREYLGLPEADPVPTVPLIPTQPGQTAPEGPPTSPAQVRPLPSASPQPPAATGQARAGGAGPS